MMDRRNSTITSDAQGCNILVNRNREKGLLTPFSLLENQLTRKESKNSVAYALFPIILLRPKRKSMQVILMDVRDREIKEETEDRIVVTDNAQTIGWVLADLFMIVIGLIGMGFAVVMGYLAIVDERGGWLLAIILWLFMIWMCGYYTLETLQELLIKKTVIIDRKLQSIIIEKDSFIKYLKSIKKISFLEIECIKIRIDIEDGRSTGHRDLSLTMIHGNKVEIYDGNDAPTEKLARNIRNITEKQIARENNCYSWTYY